MTKDFRSAPEQPCLLDIYCSYLLDHDLDKFRTNVRARYSMDTILRILSEPQEMPVVLAALATLREFGDSRSVGPWMTGLLAHEDEELRRRAEDVLRESRFHDGTPEQQKQLRALHRANCQGSYDEAKSISRQLVHSESEVAEVWFQRALTVMGTAALTYVASEKSAIASTVAPSMAELVLTIQYCEKAVELNPYHFDAYVSLGMALEGIGERSEAERAYRQALHIHPHFEKARQCLARLNR